MYVNEEGKLNNSRDVDISIKNEEEIAARLYFLKNPYPKEVLKDFLAMADEVDKLDAAKASKIKELITNPEIDYDLKALQDRNLLDKSRKEALIFIDEFKSGEEDE